jgi:hypothetical protein
MKCCQARTAVAAASTATKRAAAQALVRSKIGSPVSFLTTVGEVGRFQTAANASNWSLKITQPEAMPKMSSSIVRKTAVQRATLLRMGQCFTLNLRFGNRRRERFE